MLTERRYFGSIDLIYALGVQRSHVLLVRTTAFNLISRQTKVPQAMIALVLCRLPRWLQAVVGGVSVFGVSWSAFAAVLSCLLGAPVFPERLL